MDTNFAVYKVSKFILVIYYRTPRSTRDFFPHNSRRHVVRGVAATPGVKEKLANDNEDESTEKKEKLIAVLSISLS